MNRKRGYLYILLAAMIYSTTEVALKGLGGVFAPMQITCLRFLIGGILLIPFALRSMKKKGAAFTRADALFDPTSTNTKVIVMFTDGKTTVGAPPAPVAEAAKAQGVIIYCIGLVGTDGVDVDALNQWGLPWKESFDPQLVD